MRPLTPPGVSGIAVVGVEPGERSALLSCLRLPTGRPFACSSEASLLALLAIDGAPADEVLVVDRGSRGLELHLHGSPAVLATLRSQFVVANAPATSDEPAAALLGSALCREQLDLALEQRAWRFSDVLDELASWPTAKRVREVAKIQDRSFAAMAMFAPLRIVLVGAQNAGKSTVFNHLLFRERVLTGPLPGITRDAVVESTTLSGYPYEIVDTPGDGIAVTTIDAAAIAAGRALCNGSSTLLLVDKSRGPKAGDLLHCVGAMLVIATKDDLDGPDWPEGIRRHLSISCTTSDAAQVRNRVGELLRHARHLPPAGRVGGVAALTPAQFAALAALAADTGSGRGRAAPGC